MYYETEGPNNGIPMLMLHGFGCQLELMRGCMEPAIEAAGMKDKVLRVYVDLPGHGRSNDAPLSLASSDAILNESLAVIDEIVPDRKFAVVGQSYGGYITLGMMAACPERLLGSALICPLSVDRLEDRRTEKGGAIVKDEAFLSTLTEAERESFLQNAVRADHGAWVRFRDEDAPGFASANPSFLDAVDRSFPLTHGASEFLEGPDFDKPAVLVCGRQDSMVGYLDQARLLPKLTRGTMAVLDIAGHNLQFEQPELFCSLMAEWLQRL